MLRLLEVTAPDQDVDSIQTILDKAPVIHIWVSEQNNPIRQLRILLDAQHTEELSDQLMSQFGSKEDFRLILFPVEATLPAVDQTSEANSEDSVESEAENGCPQRISREELYEDLIDASVVTRLYIVMVALSTIVAAIGLLRGDVAIIIGAMVIAPLLGPNIALPLAFTLGDLELAKKSFKTIGIGVITAGILSTAIGWGITVEPTAPELIARTHAGTGDIILAFAAGAAGSLAFTSGAPAVVVGVMVAVALLPPLVAAGLLAGSGHAGLATGALMLALTNVTCINLAAVATFFLQKVRPRTWWEAARAKKATRFAVSIWIILLLMLFALMLLGYVEAG
ncbi:MAG: TIGR00341 family protein [Pseudomonadales bacterium]|nr:TIGR00341 family protein [Pseudomonadales bacterium]MCP5213899.1 TIGR00341 family protein [Pseudomonadales bacterium]MCP5302892.1 TIGR00341 family protein [Pseudomonadales bacterium]